MLMSKSRLEKFLYALYSLDSSDLPTPLSRIEELYKCWVTGEEAPTFEPISRVEKYLMAILGVYDVDSLPNPLSRVEVLLYKLATGDDNLDDVKSFLSEHEELLAEIIRNGGVGGNIDIEYVLHTLSSRYNTLYNTAKKPVKSAILKGKTLVNHCPDSIYTEEGWTTGVYKQFDNFPTLVKGKTYTFYAPIGSKEGNAGDSVVELQITTDGTTKSVYNTFSNGHDTIFKTFTMGDRLCFTNFSITGTRFQQNYPMVMILDGEWTQESMPEYFKGMQSVKMPVLTTTGKNLFDITKHNDLIINDNGEYITTKYYSEATPVKYSLKKNTTYSVSYVKNGTFSMSVNDVWVNTNGSSAKFTTDDSGEYIIKIGANSYNTINKKIWDNIQIEEGSATEYEPYKSNILTTNEEVELRKVGDVQDEVNLMTGEMTERIGEIVLDGSENWELQTGSTNIRGPIYRLSITDIDATINNNNINCICDKVMVENWTTIYTTLTDKTFSVLANQQLRVQFNGKVEELKTWLSDVKPTVQYLKTESIKTVDLSVVDQDGDNTKLSTFDDLTHVTLSSEGLIPKAELEVTTKNKEVLSTMSLEMNDISTTQNALQETSAIQSENVDATMIATTEIYEELL